MRRWRRRREDGATLIAFLSVSVVCSGISASVLFSNMGKLQEARAASARERAFNAAEAGVDWGLARLRERGGLLPSVTLEERNLGHGGRFTLRYVAGNTNLRDEDGNGTIDDSAERHYVVVQSTGQCEGMLRVIEVTLRAAVDVPTFDAAIQFNSDAPIFDMAGNAFFVSGEEHAIDGATDRTKPTKSGLATPGDVAALTAQIPQSRWSRIQGTGSNPSIGSATAVDIQKLVDQSSNAANVIVEPWTVTSFDYGTVGDVSMSVVYCPGDLHISGGGTGAGTLVVDGDLRISGKFQWTGIIIVRGRVEFSGGGGAKRLIGALVVGEEMDAEAETTTTETTVAGTVDILTSTLAVEMASQRLAVISVLSWRETGRGP